LRLKVKEAFPPIGKTEGLHAENSDDD